MFIQQAFKSNHEWWRYLIGILIVFFGWQLLGVIPLTLVAFMHAGNIADFAAGAADNFTSLGINQNLYLFVLIIMFAFGLAGLWFAVKFIHRQPVKELTTSREKVDWSRIRFAFLMVIVINLVIFGIGYLLEPEAFVWNFQPVPFAILCVIAIFFLPLQTSFEEYLFRGYLMQGLGVLARNRWFPLIFTSVSFGLLHSLNPEVDKLGSIVMVVYIGTGFLLGIMTLMDEGMELALGFHAGNNVFAVLMMTTDWTALQAPALFRDISEPTPGVDVVAPVLIIYPIYLYILARKYNWTGWNEKLFGKVYPPARIISDEEI